MYGYMYVSANIIIIRISIQEKKKLDFDHFFFFYNVLKDITVIDNFDIHICFISTNTIKQLPANTENCILFKIKFFFLSSELICAQNKI